MRLKLFAGFFLILVASTDAGEFKNNPGTVHVHENYDWEKTVWSDIDAKCSVKKPCTKYKTTTYYTATGFWGWVRKKKTRKTAVYTTCPEDISCDTCSVRGNSMFEVRGLNVVKKQCTAPGCGPHCSASYCLNGGDTHTVTVGCKATGYNPNGYISTTFKVVATSNQKPTISLKYGSSISVSNMNRANTEVNRILYSDPDINVGNDYIRYSVANENKFIAWDYTTRTDKLFRLNTGNGRLYVNKDLSREYSYTYTGIMLCIADRRDSGICTSLTITLNGCYQKPTCEDKSKNDFMDTHEIGATLFTMKYPNPSMHFTNFRNSWAQLQWTIDSSDLDVAVIDYYNGILKTSGNITVWPYQTRDFYATIRVGNSESCGRTTTCTMNFRVTFTNWHPRFESLPTSASVSENNNDAYTVHQIITYDQNNPAHDNITCYLTSFSPYESNLFGLKHDGGFRYNSWSIYRHACSEPGCMDDCPKNIGCFTYDTTVNHRFVFNIRCEDAYKAEISSTFTLYLIANIPPVFTAQNEPIVYISKDSHNEGDSVTQVYASNTDANIDDDFIRYWVADDAKLIAWDYPTVTRTDRLFRLNTATGEITVATDLSMEYSYTFEDITVCIRDRRDTDTPVCRTLTIVLTACYQIPTCRDQEKLDFWDTHPVGDTLFEMKYPNAAYQFPDFTPNWEKLTWTLDASDLDVAEVDYNQGILRTTANCTVWPSYPFRDYFAIIRVSNSESCGRTTTCTMTFRIWFTNWLPRFESLPASTEVSENDDDAFTVHQIIIYDHNNPAHDNITCYLTSFSPYESSLFELKHDGGFKYNSWSIYRHACSEAGCIDDCPKNIGCFTYDTTADHKFVLNIRCEDAYKAEISSTFTLYLKANIPPIFTNQNEPIVYISKESHSEGDPVTQVYTSNTDAYIDNDYIRYWVVNDTKFIAWDYPNVTRTDRLFSLNTVTGEITVAADLSMEYSKTFENIILCIRDRRDTDVPICRSLTIVLTACYEIPTCYDQEKLDFWDTHPVGDSLFVMKYPDATYHFPDFTPNWAELTWTMDYTDLDVAVLDAYAGILRTSANVTVWPSWRYRDYVAIIRVHNSESCGRTTTCVMTFRIWFKNWPIRFINLPYEIIKNEDDDDAFHYQIITYDYNNHYHDNVTCEMSFIPFEDNLFILKHDGRYDYDSWSIHRLPCQEPECGFHCDKGIGCFTYNTTLNQKFVITILCRDAYGSEVTDDLTVRLDYNRAPRFDNVPNTITVNALRVSQHDILYSINYSDNENEILYYNYTFSPHNGIFNGQLIFRCDGYGNYYDSRANISSEVYFHNMPNSVYDIFVCGTERRNMICGTVTVNIRDRCPEHPRCYGDSITVPDTFSVGDRLFAVDGIQDPDSPGELSFSFVSTEPSYFQIDQASGFITLAKPLVATYPSKTYTLTAFVYDTEACNYGSCQFSVTAEFTNYPIVINNLPHTYEDLHEDTEENEALLVISTSDQNPSDPPTCTLIDITSSQTTDSIPQDLFRVRETYQDSNVYFIENRELPGFTAAILEYAINVECHDNYGSTAVGTLTVTIKPNEAPSFTNLDVVTSIEVDPSIEKEGAIIYIVSTVDEENDKLMFSSEVRDSFVPLAIQQDGQVYLRRDVSVTDEDGLSYCIDICIIDIVHNLQPPVCGKLNVTFISSQKYPVLSNLPDTVILPEDTAGGTIIFDVDVEDENLDSVHTFSMRVNPPEAEYMFSFQAPTGILTLHAAASLDYEQRQTYTFTFSVEDQYLIALEKKTLVLNVTNVNEDPTIWITQGTIWFDEVKEPGTVLARSVATCSDIDNDDTHNFNIEDGTHSGFFEINDTTTEITLLKEWDLEASLPTSYQLYIICTDSGNLTSKQYISVYITSTNEFDPVISPTNMSVAIDSNTTIVDNLGEITSATDNDYGDDGNFVYDIVGVGVGKTYFTMTETGVLKLRGGMSFDYDKVFKFTISVSDGDYTPRPRTATCIVTATYTAPPEEVPKAPTYCFTCTTEGVLVVGALVIEGGILCVIILHAVHHCWQIRSRRIPKRSSNTGTTNFSTVGHTVDNATINTVGNTNVNTVSNATRNTIGNSKDLGQKSAVKQSVRPQQQINTQQNKTLNRAINQQTNQQDRHDNQRDENRDNEDTDDYSESSCDESDIDERLTSQTIQPRGNQPFPSGIDASAVTQVPRFGTGNYV